MPPEAARVVVAPDLAPAAEMLARQEGLAEAVMRGEQDQAALVWRSPDALIVSFRDAALPDFASARAALEAEGWPVLTRRSGGESFAIGPGTVQVAWIAREPRRPHAIEAAYDALARPLVVALGALGLTVQIGEVAGAVCGGRYDLAVGGRKVAGLAQRWRRTAAGDMCVATAASLIVDADAARLVAAVNRFYALAGSQRRYRADAMTSLAAQLPAGQGADLVARAMHEIAAALDAGVPSRGYATAPM
jgi:lipoate-protein ligase A